MQILCVGWFDYQQEIVPGDVTLKLWQKCHAFCEPGHKYNKVHIEIWNAKLALKKTLQHVTLKCILH